MRSRRRFSPASLIIWYVTAVAWGASTQPFDSGWRFLKADAPCAEMPRFDDSHWRALNLPHDWPIEGPVAEKNSTGRDGGYLPAGIGWYRKTFTVPAAESKRRFFVDFDGVMANSDVGINGVHLGKRPYGCRAYNGWCTAVIRATASGRITVRASAEGLSASSVTIEAGSK